MLASRGSGTGTLASFCGLFGATTPFSIAKLAALYPAHAQFAREWTAATFLDVAEGFITPAGSSGIRGCSYDCACRP